MLASYGYSDGTGEYYITIDTSRCNTCGLCVAACPQQIFEVLPDDYGQKVAVVKENQVQKLSYICPGAKACSCELKKNCQAVCAQGAIALSW